MSVMRVRILEYKFMLGLKIEVLQTIGTYKLVKDLDSKEVCLLWGHPLLRKLKVGCKYYVNCVDENKKVNDLGKIISIDPIFEIKELREEI